MGNAKAETSRRQQRGKGRPWPKGQSGNPAGRPKGSGLAGELRRAIAESVPAILDTLAAQAKAGDVQAARVLLDRVLPALKAESPPVQLAGMTTGTPTERAESALRAVGAGEISPDVASALLAALGALVRIREGDDIERRLSAIETNLGERA